MEAIKQIDGIIQREEQKIMSNLTNVKIRIGDMYTKDEMMQDLATSGKLFGGGLGALVATPFAPLATIGAAGVKGTQQVEGAGGAIGGAAVGIVAAPFATAATAIGGALSVAASPFHLMYVGGKCAYHSAKNKTSDKTKDEMREEIEQETKDALQNLVINTLESIINGEL